MQFFDIAGEIRTISRALLHQLSETWTKVNKLHSEKQVHASAIVIYTDYVLYIA